MFKYLKVSSILIAVIFVLSFSTAQACPMIPGKSGCNEPCGDKACEVAKIKQVSTSESADTEEVVLNVKGMTCGGCENKVKGALTACEGVKEVHVSHKDGKAIVHIEKGKANKEKLIEAVEKVGFAASEG
jgi:copper chaperone